jgi:hypothetical protein
MDLLQADTVLSAMSEEEGNSDPPATTTNAPAYTQPPPPNTEPAPNPHETAHPPQKASTEDSAEPFLGLF